MSKAISNLDPLLAGMTPELNPQCVAFVSIATGHNPFDENDTICTFKEREGLTVVVKLEAAENAGVRIIFRAAWITLQIHSDLEAVGLTAAFATALGEAGISANVIAAAFHDHIFVPLDKAGEAMAALKALQQRAMQEQPLPQSKLP